MTVFPALIVQALLCLASVFDEAVAIEVAVNIGPLHRSFDIRPDFADEPQIPGLLAIGAGQHDEQQGRIDTAIVVAERDFAEKGHLAISGFVKDFPGL